MRSTIFTILFAVTVLSAQAAPVVLDDSSSDANLVAGKSTLIVAGSAAERQDPPSIDRPEGTKLRLGVYNVYFGSVFPQDNGQPPIKMKDRTDNFIRIHQAVKPDIWALQEVLYSNHEKQTKTVQGHSKYFNQATGEDWHIAADEKGRMVFSRYPITWSDEIATRAFGVLIDVPNFVAKKDVLLLNLHLSPGNADGRLRSAKLTAEFLHRVARGKVKEIPKDVTVIVCGDFNSSGKAPPYRVLRSLNPDVPHNGAYKSLLQDPEPVQIENGDAGTYGSVIFEGKKRTMDSRDIDFLLYRSKTLSVTNHYLLNTLVMDDATLAAHKLKRSDVALDPAQKLNGKMSFDHLPIVADFAAGQ